MEYIYTANLIIYTYRQYDIESDKPITIDEIEKRATEMARKDGLINDDSTIESCEIEQAWPFVPRCTEKNR